MLFMMKERIVKESSLARLSAKIVEKPAGLR